MMLQLAGWLAGLLSVFNVATCNVYRSQLKMVV
jgi:hypothetical protein